MTLIPLLLSATALLGTPALDTAEVAPPGLVFQGLEVVEWREVEDPADVSARFRDLREPRDVPRPLLRTALLSGVERDGLVILQPRIRSVFNSKLPHSLNQGALWAGRGLNLALAGGMEMRGGSVQVRLAPELAFSGNVVFPMLRNSRRDRSAYATPWRRGVHSGDMPTRFGSEPFFVLDPGESRIAVELGPVTTGGSTERRWWGPGRRNALVLSTNPPGIPHLFAEVGGPGPGRRLPWQAVWIAGGLVESRFFDYDPTNDLRSLSAFAVAVHPVGWDGFSAGVARSVMSPVDNAAGVLADAPRFLTRWRCGEDAGPDSPRPCEQITALFARWAPEAMGAEVYAEWARTELPRTRGEIFRAPNHSQGYTVGLGWTRPLGGGDLRAEVELTYLEESATFRDREPRPFYTSDVIPQGYSHRGRTVGAAIGPGASSQWGAVDYAFPDWGVGLFLGRIRWDNVAYYDARPQFRGLEHDVSVLGGVRGNTILVFGRLTGSLQLEQRMNLHFRSLDTALPERRPLDSRNLTLELSLTPVIPVRAR